MGVIYGGVPWWRTTLAGSGRWYWLMGTCHGGARLDLGDGIDLWGCAMGSATPVGSGRWNWFMGARHRGAQHWLDWAMGLTHEDCATVWIGAMGLLHGGMPGGHVTLAGSGHWDRFMGACHEDTRHWLDWGNGIDLWRGIGWNGVMELIPGGLPWGHATVAGSGRWDWFMAVCGTGWNGVMGLIPGGCHGGKWH